MEMSPGNFLCSYLKNAIVFLYKIGEQEGKTDPVVVVGVWYQWEGEGGGERVWEGEYGANTGYTCRYMEI
jgi:hypothetical protein